jgi:hypothetical protein
MKTLLLILACAVGVMAQQQPTPPPPAALAPGEVIRVVEVKSGAGPVYNSLKVIFPGISIAGDNRVLVRGPIAVVDMIEEAIKKLDTPVPDAARNVELTLQILKGFAQEGAGGPIPADLDPTIKQLRSLFPFKSYKLLDMQIFRARSGKYGDISGTLPGSAQSFTFYVQPTVNPSNTPNAPRTVHLASMRFSFRQPKVIDGKTQYDLWGINTDLDAKEGQKAVVGKSNIEGSDDAIILVVTPKID